MLPPEVKVTFLANRGFEHGELMRWLARQEWDWAIRAKSDLQVTFVSGQQQSIVQLLPPIGQAYLFHNVQVIDDILVI